MAKVVKFEILDMPKVYLVGKEKQYNIEAHLKGENQIPALWDRCFTDGTFSTLEKQSDFIYDPSYVGLMIDWDMGYGKFSYICGMLFKEGVTVPEGFVLREINAGKVGLCWIKGKETADIFSHAHGLTEQAIKDSGLCPDFMSWSMELYNCPRFTAPDETGEIILDYYMPIGQAYESLGNRIFASLLATYPPFKPVMNCGASELSQRQMYDFLYDSLNIINKDLSIINVKHEQDDCYQYHQLNNSKPELILKMQNITKNFLDFYNYLFKMGTLGEPMLDKLFIRKEDMRITKKTKDKLSFFGLECEENKDGYSFTHNRYKELFPAWKLHSSIPKDNKILSSQIMAFLHGRFGSKQYSAAELFGGICSPESISELEKYFIEKGYVCDNNEMKVTYRKEYPKKQKAYMDIYYDWRRIKPLIFQFKAPHFSEIMKCYDTMDDELKSLVFNRTKICDGCGYCTQTDKTGKRPRLARKLKLNGDTRLKCPLFPSLVWGNPSESMIHIVRKLFDYSEKVLIGQ